MFHHHPFLVALALVLLVLTGCEQTTSTYTLNPDGSGKLLYTATFPLDVDSPQQDQSKKQTDAEKVAAALNQVLTKSKGVDAWADASCVATPDGLISFAGTAYFRDLTALTIGRIKGGGMSSPVDMTFTKVPGGYRVAMVKKPSKDKDDSEKAASHKDTTVNAMKRARTTWKYTRPMINVMFANDLRSYTFLTPTPATAVHGFQKVQGGYSYTFDGSKLLKAMDELLAKPDAELLALASNGDLMKDEAVMNEALKSLGFDPESGLSLEIAVSAPQFDYAKEVAAARKASPPITSDPVDSTAPAPVTTPVAASASITQTRVDSISRSFLAPGTTRESSRTQLRLAVTFAAPVTALGETQITELTDGAGKAITLTSSPINTNLADDGRGATLELTLPSDVNSVGRLTGSLAYSVGSGSMVVDLGVMAITKGAKGSALEATIDQVQKHSLALKFNAPKGQVKSIQVFTKEGQPFAVKEFQFGDGEGFCTKILRPVGGNTWPQELAFKIEFYAETKPFTAPWSVSSFSLPTLGK